MAGSCECGNETSCSIECRNFLTTWDILASQEELRSIELFICLVS